MSHKIGTPESTALLYGRTEKVGNMTGTFVSGNMGMTVTATGVGMGKLPPPFITAKMPAKSMRIDANTHTTAFRFRLPDVSLPTVAGGMVGVDGLGAVRSA